MLKIPIINIKLGKQLKPQQIYLAHYPNSQLCWAVKNKVHEVRWFEYNHRKTAEKFAKSKSYLY